MPVARKQAAGGGHNPMHVLVVEDSAVYRHLIATHLESWGFRTTVVTNGADGWQALNQPDAPNLVILDWVLPDIEGIELCQRIREQGNSRPYTYFIIVTRRDGQQNILNAMEAGADDYMVKPFDALQLKARLLVGKRILDLEQELIAARESMRIAATHDFLTGLMNRAEILNSLQRELKRAAREKKPVGVILADIDHFKGVNDSLGHLFGDEALKEVAQRLRSQMRAYDSIGRYGGEEFLVVMPGCDLSSVMHRGAQLCHFVASTPVAFSGLKRIISMSMGVAIWNGVDEDDLESLLTQADVGLYAAKQKGRNRVEYVESLIAR